MVGDNIKNTSPDVFISADGGYTWKQTLDGPHLYEILDQGALLVAIPKQSNESVLKFSTDEGECWTEYHFESDENFKPLG